MYVWWFSPHLFFFDLFFCVLLLCSCRGEYRVEENLYSRSPLLVIGCICWVFFFHLYVGEIHRRGDCIFNSRSPLSEPELF